MRGGAWGCTGYFWEYEGVSVVSGALFWVGEDEWGIILGGWG